MELRVPQVDWFRIISELSRAGISNNQIANRIGVSHSQVGRWKDGMEPAHWKGEQILLLFRETFPEVSEIPKTQHTTG